MNKRPRITSIKPGRGPSLMDGFMSIAAIVIGIVWTVMASQIVSASPVEGLNIFPLFGVIFVIIGIARAVYSFTNATAKDRYSLVEITTDDVEPDPLNERFGQKESDEARGGDAGDPVGELKTLIKDVTEVPQAAEDNDAAFCPYCGQRLQADFSFCPKCGRKRPNS